MTSNEARTILLFGATGNTGKHIVKFALEAGHNVIAFVRDPEKLERQLAEAGIASGGPLTVVQGDITDEGAVRAAVRRLSPARGDAVVSVAGIPTGNPSDVRLNPAMVRWTCDEMRKTGLKRFLYQGGAASFRPGEAPCMIKLCMPIVVPLMGIGGMVYDNNEVFPIFYDDSNDLEWIYSRPGMLRNLPSKTADGKKRLAVAKKDGGVLAFCDLAEWTVQAVFDDSLVRQAPYVDYVKA